MGGNIRGAGGSIITVEGRRALHGGTYRIIADRIVGATYLCAAACCGGEVRLRGVDPRPLSTVSGALSEAGCMVKSGEDDVMPPERRRAANRSAPCARRPIRAFRRTRSRC